MAHLPVGTHDKAAAEHPNLIGHVLDHVELEESKVITHAAESVDACFQILRDHAAEPLK